MGWARLMFQRDEKGLADEVFFTGSAAEITPIRSIDKITIGTGKRGPIVKRLQEAFLPPSTAKGKTLIIG